MGSQDLVQNDIPICTEGIEQKVAKAAKGSILSSFAAFATFCSKSNQEVASDQLPIA